MSPTQQLHQEQQVLQRRPSGGGELVRTPAQDWWGERSGLEKVGVVAVGAVGVAATVVVLAPGLASATVGGALTAAGAWFLRRGFRT